MSAISTPIPQHSLLAYRAILWAGATAGALDICTQSVLFGINGRSPIFLLQAIAGGLLGEASFRLGLASAVLGAFCHFLIAFTAAAVFYAASRRLTSLLRRPLLSGALYGIMVHSFMQLIVLPLSAYHTKAELLPLSRSSAIRQNRPMSIS